ncbi:MAG: DUF1428 domain-containing protein [Phycisphaerales bacterium JB063]
MPYVDGFVLPVPKDRVDDYRKVAEQASKVWKEHGALEYWECVGDDLEAHDNGPMSFLKMANAKDDETVIFAWVVFESREARDQANEKIMADPRLSEMIDKDDPIFDYTRMSFGGFKPIVRA